MRANEKESFRQMYLTLLAFGDLYGLWRVSGLSTRRKVQAKDSK